MTFTGSYSLDGEAWLPVGSAVVQTATPVQDVGLVCCSHADVPGRALFDGLALG